MGLGITFLGGDIATVARASRRAEEAGFDATWTTEFLDRSATVSLGAMAAATREVMIGSAIMYSVGRSPFVLAAEARDIDELSGGRLILGLGTGTKRMIHDWHGFDPDAPAVRVEELVPLLRRIWRLHEGPVRHDGRFYHVDISPTADFRPPVRETIPVYLAGVNQRMVRAAGMVGDGLVTHPLITTRYLDEVIEPALADGAARGGRDRGDVATAGYVICSIHDDVEVARREVKAQIAFYSIVRTYRSILEPEGWGQAADAMREAWSRKDTDGMIDAVPDEMVDELAIATTPAGAAAQLERTAASRCDHVLLYPPTFAVEPERFDANIDALLGTFARR